MDVSEDQGRVAQQRGERAEDAWAHAPLPGSGVDLAHGLDEHLRSVAALAESFAPGQLRPFAYLAGLWHDLGKRRPGFQRYIRGAGGFEAHLEGRVQDRDKTHSAAGAIWASKHLEERLGPKGRLASRAIQYAIAGHHAGLANWVGGEAGSGLAARLESADALRELGEALERSRDDEILRPGVINLDPVQVGICDERDRKAPGRFALTVRMLFSALVDADFLDTEAYFYPDRPERRSVRIDLAAMRDACRTHLEAIGREAQPSVVNDARARVLERCRSMAIEAPGVFSLTVPTGGGKTLSSLTFALEHAVQHGKRRVIYAIPFTSIIEQTADVFRKVFADLGSDAVLEHHSNVEGGPDEESAASRLASENWDRPLVVTTNVQLFESLFASRTSRCRKLHNIADSVIVLDEAQVLPVELLQPIVDVLRCLVEDFGVTVLLCTATQPVLDSKVEPVAHRGLQRGIGPVREVIEDVPALYRTLDRVRFVLPVDQQNAVSWEDLAGHIVGQPAALTIVNRRADAARLYGMVAARMSENPEARCWHLSGLMCAQHRSDVIAAIRQALGDRSSRIAAGFTDPPLYVVSTQLVEAGVDLDFPVVFRAMAGLDSIAQAAGRCNREGRLPQPGEVHVFVPPTDPPKGLLRQARDVCRIVLDGHRSDPMSLAAVRRYFERLYHDAPSLDAYKIVDLLTLQVDPGILELGVQFRDAAEAFRMIDDKDGVSVLVRYRGNREPGLVDALLARLEHEGPSRWLMRKLQRYTVSIYRQDAFRLIRSGDIREVPSCPGLFAQMEGWDGFYDEVTGAKVDGAPGDPATFLV